MKTKAKTIMMLSTLTLAIITGVLLISPSTARIAPKSATSPYIQTGEDWWNSSSSYVYNDSYTWDNLVWGANGTVIGTNLTYFDVVQNTSEITTTSESWKDYSYYVYLDYSNDTTNLANVSDPASVNSTGINFAGGEAYYWIWVWMTNYTYTTQYKETYTIYNLETSSAGDLILDVNDSYIRQPGLVSPSNFKPDNLGYYDSFFDSYAGNKTYANVTYTEFTYGYEIYQYTGSWVEVGSSGNGTSVSSAMHGIFEGYSVYEDRNHNGRVDVVLGEDPYYPGSFYVTNESEWVYNMIFTNCTSFTITPITNGTNSWTFAFSLNGIGAALVDYQDVYGLAFAQHNITFLYIPQEKTTFTLNWSSTRVDLKAQHEMSTTYDWKQWVANGHSVSGLQAEHELLGKSLCMNFWGDSWSEASKWDYSKAQNNTDSEYVSNDTYSFSDGGTDIMTISATGSYKINGTTTEDQGLVIMPQAEWSAQSNYYGSNGEDVATGSYQWKERIYVFGVTLNVWSGYSFKTDPVFSTIIHSNQAQAPSSFPWYLIIIVIGAAVAVIVVVVVIKKKKRA